MRKIALKFSLSQLIALKVTADAGCCCYCHTATLPPCHTATASAAAAATAAIMIIMLINQALISFRLCKSCAKILLDFLSVFPIIYWLKVCEST